MRNNNIPIHTKKDFEGMREAGSLAADVLDSLSEKIVPGISTQEINDICHDQIIQNKALPCLLYTSPSPRDTPISRMPSSA